MGVRKLLSPAHDHCTSAMAMPKSSLRPMPSALLMVRSTPTPFASLSKINSSRSVTLFLPDQMQCAEWALQSSSGCARAPRCQIVALFSQSADLKAEHQEFGFGGGRDVQAAEKELDVGFSCVEMRKLDKNLHPDFEMCR